MQAGADGQRRFRSPNLPVRENLRRMLRRQPDMVPYPLGFKELWDEVGLWVALAALPGVFAAWLAPEVLPLAVGMLAIEPYGSAHISGVRNRWWALAIGLAAGGLAYLAVFVVVDLLLPPAWAELAALLAAFAAAAIPYAATTQLPSRHQGSWAKMS